ncbi:hypothetical protein DRE_04401 [Drechslerella stenobrocha 248]|uniref:Mid2 domain-containing protein n=1 Tax=Drechslerella stenobrocha 248 TaxID=1043628 RepID=W7I2A5_9PEZI|nr:hypothetical protein DRE_04401 [Drechslerella stenobrocha 248]
MTRRMFLSVLALGLIPLVTSSVIARQAASPAPTYTYTQDTLIRPTAGARFQVERPVNVVWYIPPTSENTGIAEAWNVTIALDGKVAREVANVFTSDMSGDHEANFTPGVTWPVSEDYQIIIYYDSGLKSLVSPNFGIFGGGQATRTSGSDQSSTTSRASGTQTAPPTTSAGSEATGTPASTSSASSESPSASAAPGGTGVSAGTLGGAIGGAVVATLGLVGLFLFLRKRRASAALNPRGAYDPDQNDGKGSGPVELGGAGGQSWSYQQVNAHSSTSLNATKEYQELGATSMVPPARATEMPTEFHQDPVEMYAVSKERAEVMGDTNWAQEAPLNQQQQQGYNYAQQSHGR